MLAILRVLFGFALFAVLGKAVEVAGPTAQTEGTTDAGYLAIAVLIGIANAVVWAPWVGRWMADPLTGAFTAGHPADFKNSTLQLAHKLALRRWRRMALFFAFLDGVRHPDLPGAFVLGMNQARPGSWLEKVFAKEVWRFENAENCLRAWRILQKHRAEPEMHRRAEVHLLILSQQREVPSTPETLVVTKAPPVPRPVRNPAIRIFGVAGGRAGGLETGESAAVTPVVGETGLADPGEPALGSAQGTTTPVEVSRISDSTPVPTALAPESKSEAEAGAGVPVGIQTGVRDPSRTRRKLGWAERLKVIWTGTVED